MAAADCGICEAAGYRSCDRCGNVVFPHNVSGKALGLDICGYCEEDAADKK